MSIGTAKPSVEEMDGVPHYFIDSHSINEELTAAQFGQEARKLLSELPMDTVILTGGSGMFLDALTNGLDDIPHNPDVRNQLVAEYETFGLEKLVHELIEKDPNYAQKVDLQNPARIIRALTAIRITGRPFSTLLTGKKEALFNIQRYVIELSRELMYDRINTRVDKMMESGLLEEVKQLYPKHNKVVENTVGYKEFIPYLSGDIALDEAVEQVKMNSRRYAKRQMTWFRRYEDAIWIPFSDVNSMKNNVLESISKLSNELE